MAKPPHFGTGIVWYTRDDYPGILRIMQDRHKLPRTFDEWQQRAEAGERQLRAAGDFPQRATVKADHFLAWCTVRGLDVDAKARVQYASDPKHWDSLH